MAFCGTLIIWVGIILGLADILTDIAYYKKTTFANSSLKSACAVFILIQPIWYLFIYIVYIASHAEIHSTKERVIKLLATPVFAILEYLKILPGIERLHDFFSYLFSMNEKHKLLTIENCYKL
jgi:hypothetical protein